MEQHQSSLFCSGMELADFVANTDLLNFCWNQLRSFPPCSSVKFEVVRCRNGAVLVAFVSPQGGTMHCTDLVSSDELRGSFRLFDFLCTKMIASFSIHRPAVHIFSSLLNELTALKSPLENERNPVIITGDYIGGSIASLFTLWLLDSTPSTRPLCITFGSPLVGDARFQKAVSERPTWNSSFLHIVSNKDTIPHHFVTKAFVPFGTYLICSESGSTACFEDSNSILKLLMAMGTTNTLQTTDYTPVLNAIGPNSIRRSTTLVENSLTNLEAGVVLEMTALGFIQHDMVLVRSIAETVRLRKMVFDPNKKLNERKADMAYLEWYMKTCEGDGGYYTSYKKSRAGSREEMKTREEITRRHRILTRYWKRMVSEAEKMPQKEGARFQKRWLYAGTNYRRMVEPLDIADYYRRKGNRDYVRNGRSEHYVLLEKWLKDDRAVQGVVKRNKACSLTEDSCFWAYVEEAIMELKECKNSASDSEEYERLRGRLFEFENYVMDLVKSFAVSKQVLLARSTFMEWWEDYSAIVVSSSPLADFMRNHSHNYA